MNLLLAEMRRSLAELDLGLRGDLTVSEPMERLMRALATDTVPARCGCGRAASARRDPGATAALHRRLLCATTMPQHA